MLKLIPLLPLAAGLALPAAHAFTARPSGPAVAKTLLTGMNSGPDGRLTRRVVCTPETRMRETFSCRLRSVRSTRLDAHVATVDGGLRITWQPLQG